MYAKKPFWSEIELRRNVHRNDFQENFVDLTFVKNIDTIETTIQIGSACWICNQ